MKYQIVLEELCQHNRADRHWMREEKTNGVGECPGAKRIVLGNVTMKPEAVEKWQEAAKAHRG